MYDQGFFDLQLEFAERVSALSGAPLAPTVLEYTNLYIRFGCGRAFDPAHPRWQAYLAGLSNTGDRHDWTYRFYATRSEPVMPPGHVATFGCFSYSRLDGDRVRLHFQDGDRDGRSPLAAERGERRKAELTALFADVNRTAPNPERVIGASWLYNLAAYRRLFPESYLATAHAIPRRFRHMPLWGQFVKRDGALREDSAREFRERLGRHSSLEGLDHCFPFQVLALEAPVTNFCRFYGV